MRGLDRTTSGRSIGDVIHHLSTSSIGLIQSLGAGSIASHPSGLGPEDEFEDLGVESSSSSSSSSSSLVDEEVVEELESDVSSVKSDIETPMGMMGGGGKEQHTTAASIIKAQKNESNRVFYSRLFIIIMFVIVTLFVTTAVYGYTVQVQNDEIREEVSTYRLFVVLFCFFCFLSFSQKDVTIFFIILCNFLH